MKEIKIKGINESIYHETLDNGLNIYIWANKHCHSFQGVLNVFYGGDYLDFTWKNKKYHVHRGSAHYLEHIMCESDEPILSKFNKLGSYSNAVTSNMKTAYEFVGTTKIKENIELLFNTVLEKDFREEEVLHERVPIKEEQRMRVDSASVIAYFTLNDMLFNKYPNNTELVGSKKDIESINLEELKLIYDAFYHPANMAFVLTGNVDPYECLKIIKEYFNNKEFLEWNKPKLMNYKEGKKVNILKKEIKVNIEEPEITIAVKIPLNLFKNYETLMVINILKLLLESNFGSTTLFKEELVEKKLVYNLYYTAYKVYDYIILEVGCRTKYPNDIVDILMDKLMNMEIFEDEVKRKVKSAIATLVLSYENLEEVNDIISNDLTYEGRVINNEKELLENININDMKKIYDKISFKETSVLIMLPKETKNKAENACK